MAAKSTNQRFRCHITIQDIDIEMLPTGGLSSDVSWRLLPAPRRRAKRLLEENKKIGEKKRWKGEREGRILQELWQFPEFGKVAQHLRSQETSLEKGHAKRRLQKERSQKTIPGKNAFFNERQEGGKGRKDQEKRRDRGRAIINSNCCRRKAYWNPLESTKDQAQR